MPLNRKLILFLKLKIAKNDNFFVTDLNFSLDYTIALIYKTKKNKIKNNEKRRFIQYFLPWRYSRFPSLAALAALGEFHVLLDARKVALLSSSWRIKLPKFAPVTCFKNVRWDYRRAIRQFIEFPNRSWYQPSALVVSTGQFALSAE